MPIPVDSVTHKKLVLVKSFYQHALAESTSELSTVSRLRSIIEFDLALETLLKTVLRALDQSANPSSDLNTLLQKCDAALANHALDPVPNRANINYVRGQRNAAQHEARYPNQTEANDCRTYARDAMAAVLKHVWDTGIEQILLTDLIKNDDIRELLERAEQAFVNRDLEKTMVWAVAGLETTLTRVQSGTVGFRTEQFQGFVMSTGDDRAGRRVYEAFLQMQKTLLYVALGLNYSEYMTMRQISGIYTMSLGADEPELIGLKKDLTSDEAEFVLSFCIDAVAQIEELVGDLDEPYGTAWWM